MVLFELKKANLFYTTIFHVEWVCDSNLISFNIEMISILLQTMQINVC
jgi:hypothetical protein